MAEQQTTLPNGLGKEQGLSGTLIFQGIITNEEYNRRLIGVSGNRIYDTMRRSDSTIRATLQVCKLPVQSATWTVDPVQDKDGNITPEAQEKADFIKRELFNRNINWHSFLRQVLTMLDFGFSVFEKTYELTDHDGKARIGLAKLSSRKQISIYKWLTEDDKPGIQQWVAGNNPSIIREKLAIFTHDKEGDNYEGISLLRYVYKDWDMKDKLTLVNAMALEKHGMGVPVVTARENQSPTAADETSAEETLSNMRANNKAYLKVPSTMTVEMLDMKGSTTKEVIPTLNYHDARIMKSILAGFLELGGASGSGSQSLSKDLTSLFMKSEEALANMVKAAITEDIIKQLCDLNYADMSEGYPQLNYGQIADDDVSQIATALNSLITAGAITPDAEIEDHLRESFRLPLMSADKKASYEEDHKKPELTPTDPNLPANDPKAKPKDVEAAVRAAREQRAVLYGLLVGV